MKKILVIGCPGAGKTTFAKKLQEKLNLPLYHLDLIWNKPDKTTLEKEEFDNILTDILNKDEWIIDGNYQRTLEKRIISCDTIFLLDYPLHVCLNGARVRIGKKRDDMPWIEEELDKNFEGKIVDFHNEKLSEIYNLLDEYDDKRIIIFRNREGSEEYLKKYI